MSKYLDKQALLKWIEQRYFGEEIVNEIKSGRFDVDELEILIGYTKLFADYLQEIADLCWKVHQKVRLFSEDELKKLIADLRMTQGDH